MSDLHHDKPKNQLERRRMQHEESSSMLGIVMAGLAGLFLIAIVFAYNYASNHNPALAINPAPATTTGSGVAGGTTAPDSGERPAPAQASRPGGGAK